MNSELNPVDQLILKRWNEDEVSCLQRDEVEDSILGDNNLQRMNWLNATARDFELSRERVVEGLRRAGIAR